MAPIPRIAAKPLSIITGALFTAFSSPNSSPPTNGANATIRGSDYTGSASLFNLSLLHTPSPVSASHSPSPSPTSSSSSSDSSPTTPLSISSNSSLVYFDTKAQTYTGCNNKTFSATDNVVLMNPLQFGDIASTNSTCGSWIQIQNRENTEQSTFAQIVGVCDDCEYGSLDLSIGALSELAPEIPFEDMSFDENSTNTLADLMDPTEHMPIDSTKVSPKDLLNVVWSLSDAPQPPVSHLGKQPVPTTTATTTTSPSPSPSPSSSPKPSPTTEPKPQFSGRATWYSDTHGQCEHSYSQSDMIVAINEAQMGKGKDLCGKKILVTKEGSDVKLELTIVDMCPSEYCSRGSIDISQGAFKKFADLDTGVLELQWSFL
ncbi:hypothetical protein BGZ51_007218 [Haplosporangium sp. Z 767]|nr:hypothetical protein BGZ51_007218 [Haplosporangium sp. Z 767]KAF9193671.1 hypothetical protein BGZ50_007247 [Haplosporangium sp. Z 11]